MTTGQPGNASEDRAGDSGAAAPLRRRRWGPSSPARAFSYPAFRRLLAGTVLTSFGTWMERVAIGWVVLDATGSVFLTALVYAFGRAPAIFAAPFAGSIVDHASRKRLLVTATLAKALLVAGVGVVVIGGLKTVWAIIPLVALSGVAFTFEVPSTQALVTDIVSRRDALNGISIQSMGSRAVGVLGALSSGLLIDALGGGMALFGAALMYVFGAGVVATIGAVRQAPRMPPSSMSSDTVIGKTVEGLRVMAGLPVVATLLALAVLVEILAFSYNAVLPAVAKNVLATGPAGLGALTLMAGVGSLIGTIMLSVLGDFRRKGLLILCVMLAYGVALTAFSSSGIFGLSLSLILIVGVMAAMFDALQWTLLQANVPDRMRGRAIAGWVFAIGFGWIGHLELGALAESAGVQTALMVNGGIVGFVAVVLLARASRLRRA